MKTSRKTPGGRNPDQEKRVDEDDAQREARFPESPTAGSRTACDGRPPGQVVLAQ